MALINISDAFFNLMRCKSYFLLYVYVGVGRSSERLESAKKFLPETPTRITEENKDQDIKRSGDKSATKSWSQQKSSVTRRLWEK